MAEAPYRSSDAPRRLAGALVAVLLLNAAARCAAEDRVTIRTRSGAGTISLGGRIIDWNGQKLRIRSGQEFRDFDADEIVDVRTEKTPRHAEGLAAFETGKLVDANELLTQALADESRGWMRREILAKLTQVDLAHGDRSAAMTDFLTLVESDPGTRFFNVIPLDWNTASPAPALAAFARPWLKTGTSDVERLLGASVLLFDPTEGESAYATLNRLATTIDPRIFNLARAQMWRRTLARGKVPPAEIERWESRVNEVPEPLRGGVYSLIGRAWADAGDSQRAVAALLWLPTVYDGDVSLAAEAAVAAGDELDRTGRRADAVRLYREALGRFPYAPAAALAQSRLERIAAESASPQQSTPPAAP